MLWNLGSKEDVEMEACWGKIAIAKGNAAHNMVVITPIFEVNKLQEGFPIVHLPNSIGVFHFGLFCKNCVFSKADMISGGNVKTGSGKTHLVMATWAKPCMRRKQNAILKQIQSSFLGFSELVTIYVFDNDPIARFIVSHQKDICCSSRRNSSVRNELNNVGKG